MTLSNIRRNITISTTSLLIGQFFILIGASMVISVLAHNNWVSHLEIYHTILELICVFIALSIFVCIWYIYETSSKSSYVLCFGYLAVAIFDSLHAFYFLELDLTSKSYFDLSTRYWILGRLAEAFALFFSVKAIRIKGSKWLKLILTLIITLGVSYFAVRFHDYLPVLLTSKGVTPVKVVLEYIIISIYIFSLYKSRKKLNDKSMMTYKYIALALLLSLSSEFCFTLYTTVQSVFWTMGHVLKIISYFYIFKGIFISSVTFPYERLESEHNKLEEANGELKDFAETLNDILDALPIAVQTYDSNGRLKYVNKKYEELLECNRDEVYGLTSQELTSTDEDGRHYYEASLITPGGKKKELMLETLPIKNMNGNISGRISVTTDVTEINKRQQKILQQEKLALLGQMGAAIVHETRNYLTTIKGRCQLIELYAENKNVKLHAAKINTEIGEVNRIISEFLFLSKPRETELVETSMRDIFEAIESMVKTGSLVNGVDVEIELCKEERYLLCDESQLKQVILNLCKNAVEAMAECESAKLKIETGFNEETNEMYISVADNGKGISEAELSKLGTPFFTTKDTGTGLGLSVCYKIVKELRGRLEVKSKLGEGTSFIVVIPCIEDDEEELEEVM